MGILFRRSFTGYGRPLVGMAVNTSRITTPLVGTITPRSCVTASGYGRDLVYRLTPLGA
jgi:hypothetical protein